MNPLNFNLKRQQLDTVSNKLEGWQGVRMKAIVPYGWIRTIRKALSMPAWYLAKKIGVSNQRILSMEKAEAEDRITLGTLRKAADGLGCDLVYALIPREKNLNEKLLNQAREKAKSMIQPVDHHMQLEGQGVENLDEKIELMAKSLAESPSNELWKV